MTDTNITLGPRVREAIRQLRELPDSLEAEHDPAFTVEQVNFLEKRLYEVRALLEGEGHAQLYADANLYVHDLLAKQRQIAAVWAIEDVKGIRPHLNDDQAWEVLERVRDKHDAEWGITWTTLEIVADDLFSPSDDSDQTAGE